MHLDEPPAVGRRPAEPADFRAPDARTAATGRRRPRCPFSSSSLRSHSSWQLPVQDGQSMSSG